MKQAVIDIGSNSIRLTLYEVSGHDFKVLFRNKIMAGLAGYVEHGKLTPEGIACAREGLLEYRDTLACLGIDRVSVFATASLRNISNTDEAVTALQTETGFNIVVVEGSTEALLGYYGAMIDLQISSGAFLDIGGASTETISFTDGNPISSVSYPFGSLSLYKSCVKKIMPGEGSIKRMKNAIEKEVNQRNTIAFDKRSPLICVGGTARTLMKIACSVYHWPINKRNISVQQIDEIYDLLNSRSKASHRLILKLEPDRIHTIVPGLLILRYFVHQFSSEEVIVSKYGVREGYLCQNILSTQSGDTSIRRTES